MSRKQTYGGMSQQFATVQDANLRQPAYEVLVEFVRFQQLSRKQTDGGMNQLLAIAGLDTQSKDPGMIVMSNVSIN